MAHIAPTSATPPAPVSSGVLPPALPPERGTSGSGNGSGPNSLRLKITGWMESRLGKAALPVAALAGGVAGGTLGMLTLGPVGAAIGGAGGAFFGAALFMAG